jgi:hypothetical protein
MWYDELFAAGRDLTEPIESVRDERSPNGRRHCRSFGNIG